MNTKKIWAGLFAGAALSVLSACLLPVGDGAGLNSQGDVPPPVITLQGTIQPILTQKCGGCHNSGAGAGYGNLKMATYALSVQSFFTINGTDTTEVDAFTTAGLGKKRIKRGDADSSHLFERISSTGGIKMPPTGLPLDEGQIALIRQWINEGARLLPPPIE